MRQLTRCSAALCAAIMAFAAAPSHAQEAGLYPGERIEEAAGFPALTHFTKGAPDKPLLVFIPGAHHSARVAYGGHPGSRDSDFLAYWLAERGYNVLAISYPIDLAEGGVETASPDFMIRDWGAQAAALAKRAQAENGLSGPVVALGWSMAGKVAQSIHEAAQAEGIDLDLYISLAATPPLPGMIAWNRSFPMLESGYTDRRKNYDGWWRQVAATAEAAGHEIAPEAVFKAQYQGDIPINIQGYGEQYRDGAFVMDLQASIDDAKPFDFQNFPLVGMLIPTDRADARHALVDGASWTVYNANTFYKRLLKGVDLKALSEESWAGLLAVSDSLDERLARRVPGNHFFFMGEPGAQAAAEAIDALIGEAAALKADVSALTGAPVE